MMAKKVALDYLYYEVGRQGCNLELTILTKDGSKSKWRTYLDAQADEEFLLEANNRTILEIEIVLDIDPKENETTDEVKKRFEQIIFKLDENNLAYKAYFTGSKGYHIHLIFHELIHFSKEDREQFKEFFIRKYQCDLMKKSDRVMIALEDVPHWKTGNLKTLVRSREGQNSVEKIREELKQSLENERIQELISKLEEPEIKTQYLDLGFVNNFWYYGFLSKGKEAIITSDKRIFKNTEGIFKGHKVGLNEIKEHLNYDGYIGNIAPLMSKEAIKKFLISNKPLDKKEVFRQVVDKISYYMDFGEQESIAYVQACWIVATHCYPLFYWFPHVLFNAPSESGKSKNSFVLMQLSFRGFDLGASAGVTPAQIFRTLEGNRGTILIDEYEKQEQSETQQLVNQILNASATRDSSVIRTEQIDKKWRALRFSTFCPKLVCNITGINPTSLSRFITFQLLKTNNAEKSKRKPYRQKDVESFKPLRDSISILILENWQEIKQIYDTLELSLINRDEDNWLPICAIAKFLDEDIFEKVLNYIQTYQEIRIESDDITYNLFLAIYENVIDELKPFTPKEISVWMNEELASFKSPAHWIGRKLKQYQFKSTRQSKGVVYQLNKKNVKNILDRYFSSKTTLTTETTLNTLNTQTTQEDVVNVDDVVMPKVNEDEFLKITKEFSAIFNPDGDQLYTWLKISGLDEKEATDYLNKLKLEGSIFENPANHFQVLE